MVAIVTGTGLGLERSSGWILGSRGQLGNSMFGGYGENVTVNAATGNLIVNRTDEILIGKGPDAIIGRSYNSLGAMNDDNGDNWRLNAQRRVTDLIGTAGAAGSTVTRIDWDGSATIYTWNETETAYVFKQGPGAHDQLKLSLTGSTWTWTDGNSRMVETYDNANGGQIMSAGDIDGNSLTYSYTGSLLTRVTTANGESTRLVWDSNNLMRVETWSAATGGTQLLTRVYYDYDSSNRLTSVTTDLSPANNTLNNVAVVTSYTYDGSSRRIASITQKKFGADPSEIAAKLEITYDAGRVKTYKLSSAVGVTSQTSFTYGADFTIVKDALDRETKLTYDANGQLTKIELPPAEIGGEWQTISYTYTADGNVSSATTRASSATTNGTQTNYYYDAHGNMTEQREAVAFSSNGNPTRTNVTRWTYGSSNEVLTEQRFTVPDPDGAGATGTASNPLVTRYVYDVEVHLRFVISGEGAVTEYRYNASGQQTASIAYRDQVYPLAALNIDNDPLTIEVPTEAQVANWASGLADRSTVARTDTAYDFRGNVWTTTSFSAADIDGVGDTGKPVTLVTYTYDPDGNLRTRQTNGMAMESFAYDGLGRMVSATDLNGGTTTILFDQNGRETVTTTANNFSETSIYDIAGRLISVTRAGTATYAYDALDRLVSEADATDVRRYHIYDGAGRKVADVAEDGSIVEYGYDADNRLVETVRYRAKVASGVLGQLIGGASKTIAQLRPTDLTGAEWEWRIYDKAGRLIEVIDGDGKATVFSYDGVSRLIQTKSYSNRIASATIASFKETAPTTTFTPTANAAQDVVTRTFYDSADRVIATLDGAGYLARTIYDGAGQVIETIAYANATGSLPNFPIDTLPTLRAQGTLEALLGSFAASAADDVHSHFAYDGRGLLRYAVDADLRVTEYIYTSAGLLATRMDYDAPITGGGDFGLTDIAGQVSALGLASRAGLRRTRSVYDAAGRLAYSVDAVGGVVAYAYDMMGQVVKQTAFATLYTSTTAPTLSVMNSWAGSHVVAASDRVDRMFYDGLGRLVYSVDAEGYVTKFVYDAEDRVLEQIRYAGVYAIDDADTRGDVTAAIAAISNAESTAAETISQYDPLGRLQTTTGPTGSVTYLAYDALGHVTDRTVAYGTSDATTTRYSYDAAGRVQDETIAFGTAAASTTRTTYNGLGRLVDRTVAYGTDDASVTHYVYDVMGRVLSETRGYGSSAASTVSYGYDGLGNMVTRTDGRLAVTRYDHDRNGNVVKASAQIEAYVEGTTSYTYAETRYTYNVFGEVVATTDPLGNASYSTYNRLGRLVWQVDAEGYVTQTSYAIGGELKSVKRYANRATSAAAGVSPTVTADTAEDATTSFTLDRLGRVTSVIDAMSYHEDYTLDAFGNRIRVRNKLGGITDNSFDKLGRLLTETRQMEVGNADGIIVATSVTSRYGYDKRGNRISTIEAEGLAEARTTNYAYDKADRLIGQSGQQFFYYQDGGYYNRQTVGTTMEYDARGNLIKQIDANLESTYFYYDELDRRIGQIDAFGSYSRWTYDANDNVLTARVYANTVAPGASPSGPFRQTAYVYDGLDRLKSTTLTEWTGTVTAPPINWDIDGTYVPGTPPAIVTTNAYDKAGNVTRQTDARGNSSYYYYDKLGRRIAQVDAERYYTLYTLDADGNVVREERSAYRLASVPATVDGLYSNRVGYSQFESGAIGWGTGTNPAGIVLGDQPFTGTWQGQPFVKSEFDANNPGEEFSIRMKDDNLFAVAGGERLAVQVGVEGQGATAAIWAVVWFVIPTGNGEAVTTQGINVGELWGPQGYDTKIQGFVDVPAGAVTAWIEVYARSSGSGWGALALTRPIVTSATSTQTTFPSFAAGPAAGPAADGSRITTFTYDRNGRRLTEQRLGVLAHTVNSSGVFARATSSTAKISYTYNALGQVTSKREATLNASTDTTSSTVKYRYDAFGRQDWIEYQAYSSYLDNGTMGSVQNKTHIFYDGLGNIVRSEEGFDTSQERVTRYYYEAGGRLWSMTDASGFWRRYEYDAVGNVTTESYYRTVSNGSINFEAIRYTYDALGRVIRQGMAYRDAPHWEDTGDWTTTTYNAYGEVTARGVNGSSPETYSYDAAGRVWKSTAGDGAIKLYVYDANGNRTLTIASSGSALPSNLQWSTITIAQAMGLLTANGTQAVGTVNTPSMATTVEVYDKRNQNIKIREDRRELDTIGQYETASWFSRRYNAFGEVVAETDRNSHTTDYRYNTLGKLIRTEKPEVSWTAENGTQSMARPTDYYYYDISGRMVAVRDANGNLTRRTLLTGTGYGGDEALVVKEFHADGAVTNDYDVVGNLRRRTDENGKADVYAYDGMGRMIRHEQQARAVNTVGNATGAVVQLIDHYSYDGLGQRLKHWISQAGSTVAAIDGYGETTDYDAQGRVISVVTAGGDTTNYTYYWDASATTAGLATSGGWAKYTYNSSGQTSWDLTNYFGKIIDNYDFGGHNYNYIYDYAQRVVNRKMHLNFTTDILETNTYTYFNTGLLAAATSEYDFGTHSETISTANQYDREGNRVKENYTADTTYLHEGATVSTHIQQYISVVRDALGRMKSLNSGQFSGTEPFSALWEYDLAGNIRRMKATYILPTPEGGTNGASSTQDYWYRYDSRNRFVTTQGMLTAINAGGVEVTGDAARGLALAKVERGTTGTDIFYDPAGQRKQAITTVVKTIYDGSEYPGATYEAEHRETYIYTADGYLAQVKIAEGGESTLDAATNYAAAASDGVVRANYVRDALGRVTDYREFNESGLVASNLDTNRIYARQSYYNARSQLVSDTVTTVRDGHTYVAWSDYSYVATLASDGLWSGGLSGTYMGGPVTRIYTTNMRDNHEEAATLTTNRFAWYDGLVQASSTYDGNASDSSPGTWISTYLLDPGGNVQSVTIVDGRPRTVWFVNDLNGQVLKRDERTNAAGSTNDPLELHFYFDGIKIGDVTNNGTSNVDYVKSIADHIAPVPEVPGPFRGGSSYAQPYADFDQSYDRINGLTYETTGSRYTVQGGETLQLIAQSLWGDASLWYLIADANGLSGSETLAAGTSLVVPNKVHNRSNNADTFRPYDPNEALGDTSPTAPKKPKKNKCGVFGQIVMVAIAVAVSYFTYGVLTGPATSILGGIAAGAVAGAAGSVVSQGFGIATGMQQGFSFKGVALAAIAGGVGGGLQQLGSLSQAGTIGGKLGSVGKFLAGDGFLSGAVRGVVGNVVTQGVSIAAGLQHGFDWAGVASAGLGGGVGAELNLPGDAGRIVNGMAGGLAGAAAESLITGRDFGDTILSSLPSIIGNTIGNLVAEGVTGADKPKGERLALRGDGGRNPLRPDQEPIQADFGSYSFTHEALDEHGLGWKIADALGFHEGGFFYNLWNGGRSSGGSFDAMGVARASAMTFRRVGTSMANNFHDDYLYRINGGIASIRSGWATLHDSAPYTRSDGIIANLNTLKGVGSILGGGIEWLTAPVIGPVDTIVGRPLSLLSDGSVPARTAGDTALVIGSMFLGPEAVLGSRTGGIVAAESVPLTTGPRLLPGEGAVGTYDDLIAAGSKGDNLTPHHIPSANRMALEDVSKGDGIAIDMEQPFPGVGGRHRATFTYGTQADIDMTARDALAAGVWDARQIYRADGLYMPQIRSSLQQLIQMNKANHPTIFVK